jgi:hypothetical protein
MIVFFPFGIIQPYQQLKGNKRTISVFVDLNNVMAFFKKGQPFFRTFYARGYAILVWFLVFLSAMHLLSGWIASLHFGLGAVINADKNFHPAIILQLSGKSCCEIELFFSFCLFRISKLLFPVKRSLPHFFASPQILSIEFFLVINEPIPFPPPL